MKVLLCLLSLVGISLGDSLVLNPVVDLLLEGMNEKLSQSNNSVIHVSKLCTEYFFPAKLNCYAGSIKDLASLRRNGDVSMTTQGNNITLKIPLSLERLEIYFHYCHLTMDPFVSVGDEVKASVPSNSIEAQLTVAKEGEECNARLDSISVTDLGEMDFATNKRFGDTVLAVLSRVFHQKLVNEINQVLEKVTGELDKDVNICDKVPHQDGKY